MTSLEVAKVKADEAEQVVNPVLFFAKITHKKSCEKGDFKR